MIKEHFKSGYVGIIGLPNTGKSTLLNRIVGRKIAIVTPKPQTTRNKIAGIHTTDECQMVFVDTPGIQHRKGLIYKIMADIVEKVMADVDVILHLIDATKEPSLTDEDVARRICSLKRSAVLALNKIDTLKKSKVLPLIDHFSRFGAYQHYVPISALTGENVDRLLDVLREMLPEGPPFYPPEDASDITERFVAAEIIREKIINNTGEEIPYSTAVTIEEFRESDNKIYIRAEIHVEKSSQKGIIIGRDGSMIKRIGTLAREDLEANFGRKVYLDLWVKVTKNWTRSEHFLRQLGLR